MMWSLVNYGTGFDNQANVMLINKSLKMSLFPRPQAIVASRQKTFTQNAGQGETIGSHQRPLVYFVD